MYIFFVRFNTQIHHNVNFFQLFQLGFSYAICRRFFHIVVTHKGTRNVLIKWKSYNKFNKIKWFCSTQRVTNFILDINDNIISLISWFYIYFQEKPYHAGIWWMFRVFVKLKWLRSKSLVRIIASFSFFAHQFIHALSTLSMIDDIFIAILIWWMILYFFSTNDIFFNSYNHFCHMTVYYTYTTINESPWCIFVMEKRWLGKFHFYMQILSDHKSVHIISTPEFNVNR